MKRFFSIFPFLFLVIFLFAQSNVVLAAMTSTNYKILWDEVSTGGGNSSSASYINRDSVGDAGGSASSTSYSVGQGFRSGIYDPVVDFTPYIEDRSTQVAATAYSGFTVTVTTASGFAANDYILIVQDEGSAQVSMMSKISSISGNNITISSNYSGTLPSIDSTNDYVYKMTTTASISLNTLSSSSVITNTIGWVASADVTQGYNVYLFSNGNLLSGSDTIPAVSDGSVTAGSSEYGGRSSDLTLATSTFDTQDTAFATDPALVGSIGNNTLSTTGFVTIKAAISTSQAGGSYTQTLTAVFVGDY